MFKKIKNVPMAQQMRKYFVSILKKFFFKCSFNFLHILLKYEK